jgi:Rv0078B-related antitoxin
MSLRDTTPEAERVQIEILRRKSEGERLGMALEMSQAGRDMVLSRIRAENPGWTDWEVKRELLRLTLHPHPLPAWLP